MEDLLGEGRHRRPHGQVPRCVCRGHVGALARPDLSGRPGDVPTEPERARRLGQERTRGHGVIINVTTMIAEFGMAEMALYGSSKAALVLPGSEPGPGSQGLTV